MPHRRRGRVFGSVAARKKDFCEILKNAKLQKTLNTTMKIDKNIDVGGPALSENGRHHQILHEKLFYTDWFSYLYDRKRPKTFSVHLHTCPLTNSFATTAAAVMAAMLAITSIRRSCHCSCLKYFCDTSLAKCRTAATGRAVFDKSFNNNVHIKIDTDNITLTAPH